MIQKPSGQDRTAAENPALQDSFLCIKIKGCRIIQEGKLCVSYGVFGLEDA